MFVMALWFFGNLQAPKDKDFAFTEFGQLPVTANGRIEPLDSLARNSLLEIREKQTLNTEPWKDWNEIPENHPRHRMARQRDDESRRRRRLAGVPRGQSRSDLAAETAGPRRGKKSDGKHYSWNQIQPSLDTFDKENERVQKIEAASRTAYENAIAKMHERLQLYATLKNTVQPADAQDWPAELAAYEKLIPAGIAAVAGAAGRAELRPDQLQHFVALCAGIPVHGQPGAAAGPAAQRRRANGGAWATPCSTRRKPNGVPVDNSHPRLRQDGRRARGKPAGRIQCRPARLAFAARGCAAEGARQGPRRSVLQPDGAVLQRDGHLRPRRTARVLLVVQFVRNSAALGGVAHRAGVCHPHHRAGLPHGAGRPAAGDESLFLRHLHRLGRGACWA